MLMNRLMCLLSSSLLFTIPIESSISPFQPTTQVIENKVDVNGMVHKNNIGLLINSIQIQYEKDKKESERIKSEKLKQQNKEKNKKEGIKQKFLITYYGDTPSQTSGLGIMANGEKPHYLACAVPNEIPLGSKIIINGKTFIAKDRGNSKYICTLPNGVMRIDVFIPRLENENNYKYEQRVRNMGTDTIEGRLIIK